MEKDSIYYYTSNYVLQKWLENETIWATRSVTSNDSMDTLYIIKHFEKMKEMQSEFQNKVDMLNDLGKLLKATQYLSLRVYKDLVQFIINKDFGKFKEIIDVVNENYNFVKSIQL